MGESYPKIRVAAVQAAPVYQNREASVQKACRLIEEAGRGGAKVVGFPEGFIAGHPVWYHFHPASGRESRRLAKEMVKNAVAVPGPATDALCEAARRAGCCVVMGMNEKRPGAMGSLFNTQLFIGSDGRILGKHQKLVPTLGERIVHTGGFGDTLRAYDTEHGKIGGLICGENSNPLALFTLASQGTCIHVASWPHHFTPGGNEMPDVSLLASRSLAYQSNCFVLSCCGIVSEEMKEVLAYRAEDRAFLSEPAHWGGSCIVAPNSRLLAGPMGSEEGILFADIDPESVIAAKLSHDYAGHYNRPGVLTLTLRTGVPRLFQQVDEPPVPAASGAGEEWADGDRAGEGGDHPEAV